MDNETGTTTEEHTDKIQIYPSAVGRAKRKQWRARIVSKNGRKLFGSTESYNNVDDLIRICDRLFPHLQREGVDK